MLPSQPRGSRLRGLAAALASTLHCLAPRTFGRCMRSSRPKTTLVGQKHSQDFLNEAASSNNSPSALTQRHPSKEFGLVHLDPGLEGPPEHRDFGGECTEGLVTAFVAASSTCIMSLLQEVTKKTLWVPPFGAVALIFAAESILAAKEGTLWCRKNIIDRLREACAGVMSACVCTVVAAQLFGDNPTALRTVVMFWAGFSMILNPKAGFFPPAGALCALYVEKALTNGALPGFEYALFPCSTGVALLLFLTRTTTFLISRPIWALRSSRRSQAQEHKTVFAEA